MGSAFASCRGDAPLGLFIKRQDHSSILSCGFFKIYFCNAVEAGKCGDDTVSCLGAHIETPKCWDHSNDWHNFIECNAVQAGTAGEGHQSLPTYLGNSSNSNLFRSILD